MKTTTLPLARRVGAAYAVFRGRPPAPDYGMLVIMPLLAAAGGSLIAYGLETLIEGRRTRPARPAPAGAGSAS